MKASDAGYRVAVPWLLDDGTSCREVTIEALVYPQPVLRRSPIEDFRCVDDETGRDVFFPAAEREAADDDLRHAALELWRME